MRTHVKLILLMSILFVLCLSVACGSSTAFKHVVDTAKIVTYKSADEVIAASELIVVVKKTSEKPLSIPLENNKTDDFTLSNVEVIQVIKPMAGQSIAVGDHVQILESEWFDEKTATIHHVEGYVKMQQGKTYTLCLGFNNLAENSNFYPIGLIYGKIPHDKLEARVYGQALNAQIADVQNEILKKFKDN